MIGGYEQVYLDIVHKLADINFEEAAGRLGLDLLPDGNLAVNFLGRKYIISKTGVETADGNPVDINNRSILVYYAASKGSGEPKYSYRLLLTFAQGVAFGSSDHSLKWMTAPLAKAFAGGIGKWSAVMNALGAAALEEGKPRTGKYAYLYFLLPKIPCQIIYYEADEEFPCEIKIMLDDGASRFLEFEQLAFLNGCLVRTLISAGKIFGPDSPMAKTTLSHNDSYT